jgi:catechol 2,3-dioxygenase-like lactoylglutathione lyase family enzyme
MNTSSAIHSPRIFETRYLVSYFLFEGVDVRGSDFIWQPGRQMAIITPMRLSHINITMPKGGEDAARSFYAGLLGLMEIPKPESIRHRGGVWFDADGLDIHVSVEENRMGQDSYRHFGLECKDVDGLRAIMQAAGVTTEDGRPAPWKRFFVRDPFGNRIEIHDLGGFRG